MGIVGIAGTMCLASSRGFAEESFSVLPERLKPDQGDFQVEDAGWQWQPIEGTFCRDGSQAGYFVNLSETSNELLIYLEGGGACFNGQTCGLNQAYVNPDELPNGTGILSGSDERNPVREWDKVYVPYCTGDVMAGNKESVRVTSRYSSENFVGYRNMSRFLERLTVDFGGSERILLAGESAGGFGAIYNFDQVQTAFSSIPVYLLDDSGIPFTDSYLAPCLQQRWRDLWDLNETLPMDCDDCRGANGGGIAKYFEYLEAKYPGQPFGFISSVADSTIRLFYGYGSNNCSVLFPYMSASQFENGLFEIRDRYINGASVGFFTSGSEHTFLTNERYFNVEEDGLRVYEWLDAFLNDQGRSVNP
jgi:hypothetical protein